jgi:hypothetical protein
MKVQVWTFDRHAQLPTRLQHLKQADVLSLQTGAVVESNKLNKKI